MNAIAGAMDPSSRNSPKDSQHSNPKRPYGAKHLEGKPGDVDGMPADHEMGDGEKFGVDELEQHLCGDCHDAVKRLASAKHGASRGEHG